MSEVQDNTESAEAFGLYDAINALSDSGVLLPTELHILQSRIRAKYPGIKIIPPPEEIRQLIQLSGRSLSEIAREANVAVGNISRFMAKKQGISAEVALRIWEVLKQSRL